MRTNPAVDVEFWWVQSLIYDISFTCVSCLITETEWRIYASVKLGNYSSNNVLDAEPLSETMSAYCELDVPLGTNWSEIEWNYDKFQSKK